ncbi:MAG: ISAs1 family transposase [Planctomycetota bacterium]|jgi:hypothetical protein|nr:ISAs1 family transposase [Planctomycetota bacterium]
MLRARIPDPQFERVKDPRRRRPRRGWRLHTILQTVLAAMAVGARSLADVEALTREMSRAARKALGIPRRLPDTTARDLLLALVPLELRHALHRQVRAAHRRRALEPDGLPWGVVSLDGKGTTIDAWHPDCAQRQGQRGVLRTITAVLVSSSVRVCIDAIPIPAATNEMGHYDTALTQLVDTYASIDLFRIVMYDAGACSEANARQTRALGPHYVMVLNEGQPTLQAEARRVLSSADVHAANTVVEDNNVRYTLWSTEKLAGWMDWDHLRTVVRIRRDVLHRDGSLKSTGERYFVASLRKTALTPRQWVTLLRRRWAVENNAHQILDTVFQEDERPWIRSDAIGALNLLLLRRLALNMLALFRGRTLRGEFTRLTPWRDLLRWAYNALIAATDDDIAGLRDRGPPYRLDGPTSLPT